MTLGARLAPGRVSTRHGDLACSRMGEGPPLFLLPANGHAATDFAAVRPALSRTFETIALDWPSMGASPPLAEPARATAAQFADMLEDASAGLAREAGIFVGHSVGGFAAARLAIRRPSSVRALVLVDSGGFLPVRGLDALFCRIKGTRFATRLGEGRFARFHAKRRNSHVEAMLEQVDRSRRDPAYAATVAAVWRSFTSREYDLSAQAAGIRCPTLVVWGRRDPVLRFERAGRAVVRNIRDARSAVLETGHSPFVEDPDGFLHCVVPFLDGLRGMPSREECGLGC